LPKEEWMTQNFDKRLH